MRDGREPGGHRAQRLGQEEAAAAAAVRARPHRRGATRTTTHLTAHAQTRTHNNTTHHTPPTLAAPSQESKGLEFDDVCIFDFFADSPRECTWAVLSTLDGDEAAAGAAAADRGAAPFDPVRDNILCEELKMLYVAMCVYTLSPPPPSQFHSRNLIPIFNSYSLHATVR